MSRKEKNDNMLTLLYRSFDDSLTAHEQQLLDEALALSSELRAEKKNIEAQRQLVSGIGEELSFRPFFAERLMNRITTEKEKASYPDIFFETLLLLFKRVALAGAAACLIVIVYNLVLGENLKSNEAFYVSQVTYEQILEIPLL